MPGSGRAEICDWPAVTEQDTARQLATGGAGRGRDPVRGSALSPGQPGQAASQFSSAATVGQPGAASVPDGAAGAQARLALASDLLPAVSAPKGGGAIRALGEKFAVNPCTGTASMTIALPLSPGRSGFTPDLALQYDSGAGNGPLGFGWNLAVPAITRKTDKGLPTYCDGAESDVFILAGAEDLVPVLDPGGARKTASRTVHGTAYEIAYYRPRVEGLFSRIERWTQTANGIAHWRTISRGNITALYGADPASRIADPASPGRIFSWRITRSWDDRGNAATYSYLPEDGTGVDLSAAHEANRTPISRSAQAYLKSVSYGNAEPYFPDFTAAHETPLPASWYFSVVLDYGDHGASAPGRDPDQPWPARPDPFSAYRQAFEVRTYRRIQRILFFNNFPDETSCGADCLVRSVDLAYSDAQNPPDPAGPAYTFLTSITKTGYGAGPAPRPARSLPPLELEYSKPMIQPDILAVDPDSAGNLPAGIDGPGLRWADLDGEGLAGVLAGTAGGWYYKRNLSAAHLLPQSDGSVAARARFGPLETVGALPAMHDLSKARLLDLSGSGHLDVVDLSGPDPGYYRRTADAGFEPFRAFPALPRLDFDDPNLALLDLTGDGLADILLAEDGAFTLHRGQGDDGFGPAYRVATGFDPERGPAVVLADGTQTIFTADMSGDGLPDLVRVRDGEVSYWPSLGYGRFGPRVAMDAAPRFGPEDLFDPRRVRLADIDGSGTADLLYVGAAAVTAWFNQSGNSWSAPVTAAVFPGHGSVAVLDLLGTGTACLTWSSPLPGTPALRYVDLMGGVKPHLLTRARNNLGAETRISYAPSTRFYLQDRQAGRPWLTRLPFPVQVVERAETIDWIGRNRLVSRYAYRHGYYDQAEREFRGFGMVERRDTEDIRADTAFPGEPGDGGTGEQSGFANWDQASWSPPAVTRTWFHTGAAISYAAEYWTEPALRGPARAADAAAMALPGTILPSGLTVTEQAEALRALRGSQLRAETYADDGTAAAPNPYAVSEQNYTITCLQHLLGGRHAVFLATPRESVTFAYERGPADPRVTHELTLDCDAYGNALRTVSAAYPRRPGYSPPEPAMDATTQSMLAYDQARPHVTGTQRSYTNAIDDPATWPDAYRVPAPAGSDSAEITGITPAVKGNGITDLFSFDEVTRPGGLWDLAWRAAADVPYEQLPAADIDGAGAPAGAPARRFISRRRVCYRADDLTGLLGPGVLEPLCLPGESYQAVFTPGQLAAIFGARVTPAILAEGGYVQLPAEAGWWAPSGRVYLSPGDADGPAAELAAAQAGFFLPRRATDPLGGITRAGYDRHAVLPATHSDPVGNTTATVNDYRVLLPAAMTDPNGNVIKVAFDALGRVTAEAVCGRPAEPLGDDLTGFATDMAEADVLAQLADPLAGPGPALGNATSRTLYDAAAYQRTAGAADPSPPAVYLLAREAHVAAQVAPTRYQHHFAYSDGFGREIQRKALAAPGPVTEGGPALPHRWAGSGWAVLDNKGRPVRRYESFFSATQAFQFAPITGVATTLLYDPVGRLVATLHPDSSWEKLVVRPWLEQAWDAADTAAIADPSADPDVGACIARALGAAPYTSWYDQRITGSYGPTAADQAAWKDAAVKAASAAGTPAVTHRDALARACLTVADNGAAGRFGGRTAYDISGRPLAVFDALGRRAQEYVLRAGGATPYLAGADIAGRQLYQINCDSGTRRGLANVAGQPIRSWDDRGFAFRMTYDAARRPARRYVTAGQGQEALAELTVYGELQPAPNLCGRIFRHYDNSGYLENTSYDAKGNLVSGLRQLAAGYRSAPDWAPVAAALPGTGPDGIPAGPADGAALDAAARTAGLIGTGDRYAGSTAFDALNRAIQLITPHAPAMRPDVLQPRYDEAGQLAAMDAWLQQPAAPVALLDPATADEHPVTAVTYNARGQRLSIALGNGVTTDQAYDPQTFRLARLTTTRPSGQRTVQDLSYYSDPAGNITRISDAAQDAIFFANQHVDPTASYAYDALYRLVAATGREHLGQAGGALARPAQVTNDDSFRVGLPQPGDGNAMGTYTERYGYDAVGNLATMTHHVSSGGWTREYAYAEPSRITAAQIGSRLTATSLPGDPAGGPFTATYAHDPHGSMTRMPHLAALTWDADDRLESTTRQAGGQVGWYRYSGTGQRVRKVTDSQGSAPARKAERIYLGGLDLYREFAADGTTVTLERQTLHITDGAAVICRVETRTAGSDNGPAQLARYQFGNHLDSALLELDGAAGVVSYEEYFPYGGTSYQAVAAQTGAPKRYRFTGKERDTENDLYYHGARYCAPWLGRWISADPAGLADGPSLYAYARDNPVAWRDPDGRQGEPWVPIGICLPAYSHCPEPGDSDPFSQAAKAGIAKQAPKLTPPPVPPPGGQAGGGQPAGGPGGGSSKPGGQGGSGQPAGQAKAADDDDNDLPPSQLLTRGQGAQDFKPGRFHLESLLSLAGGTASATVYLRRTLEGTHTTLGVSATGAADTSGKTPSGTITGVYHIAWMHDPKGANPVDISLYLSPYLRVNTDEKNNASPAAGASALGTASADLEKHVSIDINASTGVDSTSSSSDNSVVVSPSGYFGLGADFTIKVFDSAGKPLFYLYPEAGVSWVSGERTKPPALSGTTASSTQYYAGIGAGTGRVPGFPFFGIYVGVTTQTWNTPFTPQAPRPVSPPAQGVFNIVGAW